MRARPGSALILVLLMTLAVAGLAVAAIFLSSSAGLLTRFYDRERDFRLAAEGGLALARSRLQRDASLSVPDTGVVQLVAGHALSDAAGVPMTRVRVNVYAAVTGDTTGVRTPVVTLIAASYDANGTRYVRRADLRRASFAAHTVFVDSFPASADHDGPVVAGTVHSNSRWISTGSPGPLYTDTVAAVAGPTGTATYLSVVDSAPVAIPYPRDSTFSWMHALATSANLDITPVASGSRVELVSMDADGDGTIEAHEGFLRVFDASSASDSSRLMARPLPLTDRPCGIAVGATCLGLDWASAPVTYLSWDDEIVQNQCGGLYLRNGRWHFFPIATHRAAWARPVIQAVGTGDFPAITPARMNIIDDYDYEAVETIAQETETLRCYPAGDPHLVAVERFTNAAGVVTGGPADSIPFGVVPPSGGWPIGGPYGGSDTTFTPRSRTCRIASGASGRCVAGTLRDLGRWRKFAGDTLDAVPTSVRQPSELGSLWPIDPLLNPASRRVASAASGPLYLSGTTRGRLSIRVAGAVRVVDRIAHHTDPNGPEKEPCEDQLGVVATADILVVSGLTSRIRRVGWRRTTAFGSNYVAEHVTAGFLAEPRFRLQGNFMSLQGAVGVESPDEVMGDAPGSQLRCPDDGSNASRANGGCLAVTGSMASAVFRAPHTATPSSGFRLAVARDKCAATANRPPFFPLTNRYSLVRTLEIEPSLANTPAEIRAILMRLKGAAL